MNQTAISTLELSREDWLKARKRGIGASDVGAVLGLNPYRTAYQVWEEKITEDIIEEPITPALEFGIKLEQIVADTYAERTGRTVRKDHKIRVHPEHPFLFCNLDRTIVSLNGEGPGILEAKTASGYAVRNWEEEIPPYYFVQVQAQLAVTGYTWAALALLVDGRDFRMFDLQRDERVIELQTEKLVEFWNHNVLQRVPPEIVVADLPYLTSDPATMVDADDEMAKKVETLLSLKVQRAEGDKAIDAIEDLIKLFMGGRELLAYQGSTLATWKTAKASTVIDTKRFAAEMPDMAKKFETTKPGSRRFLLKSQGGKP